MNPLRTLWNLAPAVTSSCPKSYLHAKPGEDLLLQAFISYNGPRQGRALTAGSIGWFRARSLLTLVSDEVTGKQFTVRLTGEGRWLM